MTGSPGHIVVVGTGQAADSAVMHLRAGGFDGSITMIGEEPVRPYQRPPLTKAYMTGEMPEERLYFRAEHWYHESRVELFPNSRVVGIDTASRKVVVDAQPDIAYDTLILATGSRPRKLEVPGADLANVFDLRTLHDARQIRPALDRCDKLVVVGAGYIGLEAAASARQLGLNVTVLEYAPRVLARVTSPMVSAFFEREHRAKGVEIRTNTRLCGFKGEGGKVRGAELQDGTVLSADVVLIGVGIVPNQELAGAAGIPCNDGIVVDADARSNVPGVYAAGDCTHRPLAHYGRSGRLESVQNAVEQGKHAAAAILGNPGGKADCPWFWSDQYDLKLQIAGLAEGADMQVVRGDPEERRFAVFYFKDRKLIATDAIHSPHEFMLSRRLIAAGAEPDPVLLADTSIPIKEFARDL